MLLTKHRQFSLRWSDFGKRLVRELEILLQRRRILDLHEYDRCSYNQAASQQAPRGGKVRHVRNLCIVDGRGDGPSGRLKCLVEAGEVRQLATVVRQGPQ